MIPNIKDIPIKILHISKEITIEGNGYLSGVEFGSTIIPDGYKFVGILNADFYNDRILNTYSSNNAFGGTGNITIYASFYNTYHQSITKEMACTILAISNELFSKGEI